MYEISLLQIMFHVKSRNGRKIFVKPEWKKPTRLAMFSIFLLDTVCDVEYHCYFIDGWSATNKNIVIKSKLI